MWLSQDVPVVEACPGRKTRRNRLTNHDLVIFAIIAAPPSRLAARDAQAKVRAEWQGGALARLLGPMELGHVDALARGKFGNFV